MDPKPHSWTCPKCGSLRIQPALNSTGTLGLTCGQCTHVWWELPLDHESRKPKVEPSPFTPFVAGLEVWFGGRVVCIVPTERLVDLYSLCDISFLRRGAVQAYTATAARKAFDLALGVKKVVTPASKLTTNVGRYSITVWHGESESLFYVVNNRAPEAVMPAVMATCRSREQVEPSRIVYMSAGGLTDSQGNPYPEPCENYPREGWFSRHGWGFIVGAGAGTVLGLLWAAAGPK